MIVASERGRSLGDRFPAPRWPGAAAWIPVVLATGWTSACRVPAPARPVAYRPTPPPSQPAPTQPIWFGASEPEEAPSAAVETTIIDRPPSNLTSPLGANLSPLDPDASYVAFTDAFRQASGWRSQDWKGRTTSVPVDVDAQGWIRRLAANQVAVARVPTRPGASYVITYEGDGRLEVEGASPLRRGGPRRLEAVATSTHLQLRIERTSPSSPLRNIRVLPERWADRAEIPRFDPVFVERVGRFGVIRFAGWARVGTGVPGTWSTRTKADEAVQTGAKGVAWEHMLDLANQTGADAWLCVPFAADEDYLASLAELARTRLDPRLRVFVELGDEAWSPDRERPGIRILVQAAEELRLDPDPTLARLFYQVRRSRQVFDIFERGLGRDRLVRVMSAPVGAPTLVRLALEEQEAGAFVDAIAVAPRVGGELATPERSELVARGVTATIDRIEQVELPSTITALRQVAEVTNEAGVDLLAYEGGLDLEPRPELDSKRARRVLEQTAVDAASAISTLALLDAWKAAGGRLFVVSPLFGPGRALPDVDTSAEVAPQFGAYVRFMENEPRWWARSAPAPRPEPPASIVSEPAEPPSVAAVADSPPPPPKMYTAPWAKWVTLGVGALLGGLAAERFVAADGAAARRDEGIAGLAATVDPAGFDRLQDQIRDDESERGLAQGLGFAAVGLSSALVGWAIAQWLEEPPEYEPAVPSWAEGTSSP